MSRIVVLTGNHQQFLSWCHENGKSPTDRSIIYPASRQAVAGLSDFVVVRYGTWQDNPAAHDVAERERIEIRRQAERR